MNAGVPVFKNEEMKKRKILVVEDEESIPENNFVVDMEEDVDENEGKEFMRNALEIGLGGVIIAIVIFGIVAGIVALARKKDEF